MSQETNIFEQASKLNLTVQTAQGQMQVNDLWSLKLTKLDNVAVQLDRAIKADNTEGSFLENKPQSETNRLDKLRFDIVIHIIKTKEADQKRQAQDLANRQEIQELTLLLHDKQKAEQQNLTIEQIQAKITEIAAR